jgi:hypothetical protein
MARTMVGGHTATKFVHSRVTDRRRNFKLLPCAQAAVDTTVVYPVHIHVSQYEHLYVYSMKCTLTFVLQNVNCFTKCPK